MWLAVEVNAPGPPPTGSPPPPCRWRLLASCDARCELPCEERLATAVKPVELLPPERGEVASEAQPEGGHARSAPVVMEGGESRRCARGAGPAGGGRAVC